MGMTELEKICKKLILFGGKGGVGKTTCAAAAALHFAEIGRETLIISSDPTPSLSDVFGKQVGPVERPIEPFRKLHALEISSDLVLQRWKERYGQEVYEVISSFVPVEYDIVDYVGGAPGIEEEYMLGFILDIVKSGRYDSVVWDTAPAGHTLNLLGMPQRFLSHLEAAVKVYTKVYASLHKLRLALGLSEGKRSALDIINGWKALAKEVMEFITDSSSTEFIITMIPEALGIEVTKRILATLNDFGIKVNNIIINNVITEVDCKLLQARRKMQMEYINRIRSMLDQTTSITIVPMFSYEIRGIDALRQVAGILFTDT
ncbi:ArsA family ATPase [Candidatus Bathyarchaeota archaeon]|nr:ArsA family ATPase [Candidatus Bathyarchaeota archaeon]